MPLFRVYEERDTDDIRHLLDPTADEVYLSQIGVLGLPPSETRVVMARMMVESIRYAAAQRKFLRFEVDTPHADFWSILECVPTASGDQDVMILVNDRE